jgi:hypothetical protein
MKILTTFFYCFMSSCSNKIFFRRVTKLLLTINRAFHLDNNLQLNFSVQESRCLEGVCVREGELCDATIHNVENAETEAMYCV